MLKVADKAPNFELENQDGKLISLSSYEGKWLVVYFYPKDNTPGCTKEAIDFTNLKDEFSSRDCSVVGISPDSVASHQRFIQKYDLTINLLSDEKKSVIQSYGAWGKKRNYAREYFGLVRSTFIINDKGKIVEIFSNVKVRRKKGGEDILHAQDVLDRLVELKLESFPVC